MLVMAWTWAGAFPAVDVRPGIGIAVASAGVSAPLVSAAAVGFVVPVAADPIAEFSASLKLVDAPLVVPGIVSAVQLEPLEAAAAAGSASCCCIATIWSIRPTTA